MSFIPSTLKTVSTYCSRFCRYALPIQFATSISTRGASSSILDSHVTEVRQRSVHLRAALDSLRQSTQQLEPQSVLELLELQKQLQENLIAQTHSMIPLLLEKEYLSLETEERELVIYAALRPENAIILQNLYFKVFGLKIETHRFREFQPQIHELALKHVLEIKESKSTRICLTQIYSDLKNPGEFAQDPIYQIDFSNIFFIYDMGLRHIQEAQKNNSDSLDLTKLSPFELLPSLFELTNLKQLNIQENHLKSLPEEILLLRQLERLTLDPTLKDDPILARLRTQNPNLEMIFYSPLMAKI